LIILPAQALKSNPKAHSNFLPRLLLFIFLILIFIHSGIRNQKSTLMGEYVLYNYSPSLAVTNVALLLFLAATVVHIFLAIKNAQSFSLPSSLVASSRLLDTEREQLMPTRLRIIRQCHTRCRAFSFLSRHLSSPLLST
jgi:hypothetical protein